SHKRNYPVEKRASLTVVFRTFIAAAPSLLTIVIILGGIMGGVFTPTEAAGIAVIYAFFLSTVVYREMSFKKIVDTLVETARSTGSIMFIYAAAAVFGWLITLEKVPETVYDLIMGFTDNAIVILILINIILLILGMFMDIMSA